MSLPSAKDVLVLSQIIDLVRTGAARTRPEIETVTGLGRTIVNERVREGLELGVLADGGLAPSEGGRPSRTVRFRSEAGLILAACLGAGDCTVAVADLNSELLIKHRMDIDVTTGPEVTLTKVHEAFQSLLKKLGSSSPVWAIGIGLPGPVDFATGRVVAPPIMPGWNDFDVRNWFRSHYEAPIWVDNEANLMALGEWERGLGADKRDLLYLKVSTGIGSGLITAGRLHRGDTGAAGDIGHVKVTDDPAALCRCGKTGCLEAVAGGWAVVKQVVKAAEAGNSPFIAERLARNVRVMPADVGLAAESGDTAAREAYRQSAEIIGTTIAGVVNFANPGTVVLGGGFIRVGDLFFDDFKNALMDGLIELASNKLTVRMASLEFDEGAIGAALLAANGLLAPAALRAWLSNGTPIGSALRVQTAA
ncbi:MAG: ROK family protein [Pseudolysinimonas sp.]